MTTHPHGDWRCYSAGCRRPECREAWRAYKAAQRREVAYGRREANPLIDATPAADRLRELLGMGIGVQVLADGIGIGESSIGRLVTTHPRRTLTALRSTVDAILAYRPDPRTMPDRAHIDAAGTRRRLQALTVNGWTNARIAERLGWHTESVRILAATTPGTRVQVRTWRAVADLYDEVWNAEPPAPRNHYEAGQITWAKRRAAARGWAPPLAWDDESIDDPNGQPHTDTRPAVRSSVDVAEELADLLDIEPGITAERASARLGYRDAQSIYLALKRAERPDLRARLDRNNEAANPAPLVTKADAYGRRSTPTRKESAA